MAELLALGAPAFGLAKLAIVSYVSSRYRRRPLARVGGAAVTSTYGLSFLHHARWPETLSF